MRWRNWLEAKLPRIFRTTCVSDFLVELQLLLLKLRLSNGAWNQLDCREPRRPVRPPQLWAGNLTQKPLSWVTGALGSFLPTNTGEIQKQQFLALDTSQLVCLSQQVWSQHIGEDVWGEFEFSLLQQRPELVMPYFAQISKDY